MRIEGSSRDKTWPIIRRAGINLLSKSGFHGMNLRELASQSGMQAGSLYNYFKNKDELLSIIMLEIMQELLDNISEETRNASEPKMKLDKFVAAMVAWHTKRKKEALISQSELRRLPKAEYKKIVAMRMEFEVLLSAILNEGVSTKVFQSSDIHLSVIMIINMLTSIANWYKSGSRLTVDQLTSEYQGAIRRLLAVS